MNIFFVDGRVILCFSGGDECDDDTQNTLVLEEGFGGISGAHRQ